MSADVDGVVSVADMAGNLGAPLVATIGGKRYKFKLVDQLVKAAVEQEVMAQARAVVLEEAEKVEAHVFRTMYQAFIDNQSMGVYRWGGHVTNAWLKTVEGLKFLVSEVSADAGKDFDRIMDDETTATQLSAALREVLLKSFPAGKKKKGSIQAT